MSVGIALFCVALVVLYLAISFARIARYIDPHTNFDPLMGLFAIALIAAVGVFLWGMR